MARFRRISLKQKPTTRRPTGDKRFFNTKFDLIDEIRTPQPLTIISEPRIYKNFFFFFFCNQLEVDASRTLILPKPFTTKIFDNFV